MLHKQKKFNPKFNFYEKGEKFDNLELNRL
jgi:hypothetical protein